MKNNKKNLAVLLIIVLLSIIGVSTIYILNNRNNTEIKISKNFEKEENKKIEEKNKYEGKKIINNPINPMYEGKAFKKDHMIELIKKDDFVLVNAKVKEVNDGIFGEFSDKTIVKTELKLEEIKILNEAKVEIKDLEKIYFNGGIASVYDTIKWNDKIGIPRKEFDEYNKIAEEEQKNIFYKTTFSHQAEFKKGDEYTFLIYKEPTGKYMLSPLRLFKKIEEKNGKIKLQNVALPEVIIEKQDKDFK